MAELKAAQGGKGEKEREENQKERENTSDSQRNGKAKGSRSLERAWGGGKVKSVAMTERMHEEWGLEETYERELQGTPS